MPQRAPAHISGFAYLQTTGCAGCLLEAPPGQGTLERPSHRCERQADSAARPFPPNEGGTAHCCHPAYDAGQRAVVSARLPQSDGEPDEQEVPLEVPPLAVVRGP